MVCFFILLMLRLLVCNILEDGLDDIDGVGELSAGYKTHHNNVTFFDTCDWMDISETHGNHGNKGEVETIYVLRGNWVIFDSLIMQPCFLYAVLYFNLCDEKESACK